MGQHILNQLKFIKRPPLGVGLFGENKKMLSCKTALITKPCLLESPLEPIERSVSQSLGSAPQNWLVSFCRRLTHQKRTSENHIISFGIYRSPALTWQYLSLPFWNPPFRHAGMSRVPWKWKGKARPGRRGIQCVLGAAFQTRHHGSHVLQRLGQTQELSGRRCC